MEGLQETHFSFEGQTGFYRGKVRDVYYFDGFMVAIATDRISAFDVVLPRPIQFKGAILNGIAAEFLQTTQALVPNWLQAVPDPQVSVGVLAAPFPVEMVVRGYLVGHAWRTYAAGERILCGVPLPDGLRENDPLPGPIITPSTKAHEGHDEDISREEILARGLVSPDYYPILETYALRLFAEGQRRAAAQGLILADTKYEFGLHNGQVILIDEVHTPDSSRYFYADGFAERQAAGQPQRQLSKEFVRQWLLAEGFSGKEGQQVPIMTDDKVAEISARYQELYQHLLGKPFMPSSSTLLPQERIETAISAYLAARNAN
jgi:phosphoribosylaminoimidazole-succinocarboxamide synthase